MNKRDRQVILICFVLAVVLIYSAVSVKSLEQENFKLSNRVEKLEKQLDKTKDLKEQLERTVSILDENARILNNILKED